MSEKQRILAANDAFYTAFRTADFGAMEAIWAKRRKVSVNHPNWPGIETRDAVMESWYRILVLGDPPPVRMIEPLVIMSGDAAMVICREDLGSAQLIATNVFVKEDGKWVMTHHQASRLPGAAQGSGQNSQERRDR